ncbi:MAG: hypothetical protein UT62_C0028G0008, partial [Parcubacteria group bacterium GW2011_GWC1_39_8]
MSTINQLVKRKRKNVAKKTKAEIDKETAALKQQQDEA